MNEQKRHSLENILNLPASTDWHETGVYAVVNAEGKLFQETVSETAHSARATLFRELNMPWSRASEKGMQIVPLVPAGRVESLRKETAA